MMNMQLFSFGATILTGVVISFKDKLLLCFPIFTFIARVPATPARTVTPASFFRTSPSNETFRATKAVRVQVAWRSFYRFIAGIAKNSYLFVTDALSMYFLPFAIAFKTTEVVLGFFLCVRFCLVNLTTLFTFEFNHGNNIRNVWSVVK